MKPLQNLPRFSRSLRLAFPLGVSLLVCAGASAGDAIHSPADWQGIWRGQYVCAQGVTALTLTIRLEQPDKLTATFSFHAHPDNPGVPAGEYRMAGELGSTAGHLTLNARSWIKQPRNYVTVGLDGDYDPGTGRYHGTVDGPGCGTFYVQRDLVS